MERLTRIGRSSTPFDVVHLRPLIDDNERTLELSHVLAIDTEVGLYRHILPGATCTLAGLDVVVDVVKINLCDVATPGRQRLLEENLQSPEPRVAHPLRLLFDLRDLFDDVLIQTLFGPKHRLIRIVEAKLILTLKGTHFHTFVLCRWRWPIHLLCLSVQSQAFTPLVRHTFRGPSHSLWLPAFLQA